MNKNPRNIRGHARNRSYAAIFCNWMSSSFSTASFVVSEVVCVRNLAFVLTAQPTPVTYISLSIISLPWLHCVRGLWLLSKVAARNKIIEELIPLWCCALRYPCGHMAFFFCLE